MDNNWFIYTEFGLIFIVGLIAAGLGRLTKLPRVTLFLLFGILIGPSFLDIIKPEVTRWYPMFADITLVMIGFLLGGKFTLGTVRNYGNITIIISLMVVLVTAMVVIAGLLLLGSRPQLAIILGAISTATAPVATLDVINELNIKNRFTRMVEGIVALDDAWGLVLFSLLMAAVKLIDATSIDLELVAHGLWEIGGAILLGILLGFPMSILSRWIRPKKLTMIESLGYIFLCAGLAQKLEVSALLAAMFMGSVVTNFAEHKKLPFTVIEEIGWPFIIIFFIIAGAGIEISELLRIGFLGVSYIFLRISGKIIGGYISGKVVRLSSKESFWTGMALMPQAGVAIGMALVAVEQLPGLSADIMNIVIGSTIFFEIFGTIATRMAVQKTENTAH